MSTLTDATLAALREPHTAGHRCTDGQWWNPNAGTRTPCPTSTRLATLTAAITDLRARVHAAAHDDHAAMSVGQGITGYSDDWVEELDPEDRAGMLAMGRMAIEALAAHLDGVPTAVDQ